MTATYGEVGLSYAAANTSYDGTELEIDPFDALIYYHAEGGLSAYTSSNRVVPLVATGPRARFTSVGPYAPTMTSAGTLVRYAVTGALEDYNISGVADGVSLEGYDSGFDDGFGI